MAYLQKRAGIEKQAWLKSLLTKVPQIIEYIAQGAKSAKGVVEQGRGAAAHVQELFNAIRGRSGMPLGQAQREINNALKNLNSAAKRQGLTSAGTAVQSRINEIAKMKGTEQSQAWSKFLDDYMTPDGASFEQAWGRGSFVVPNISKDLSHQISSLQAVGRLNTRGKNLLADLQRVNNMPVGEARHALYESIMNPIQGSYGFNRMLANNDFRKTRFWKYLLGTGIGAGALGTAALGGAIYSTAENRGNLADHEKDPSKAVNRYAEELDELNKRYAGY